MYKIAIAGASSLLGRELKDVLADSPLAACEIVLFDEEETRGQLEQVGDEVAVIQSIGVDAFDRVDFTFFCGSEALTRHHWQQAVRSGSTVLDLTGALDQETGVLVRASWLGAETSAVDLFTPAVVPAHPAAVALVLLLRRVQQAAPIRFAAATVLAPSSEFGRAAMDELHRQTVNLLNFQSLPRAIYDAQAAFNLLCGMGEEARASLSTLEDRIRRHYEALTGGCGSSLAVQIVHAPVFHGLTFSIAIELDHPVENASLEEALAGERVELVLEDTDSPSNLAITGQDEVHVRLRTEPLGRNTNQAQRLWLWAAADNLRLNAQNAVQCALDLRRLRPQGTVQ